MPRLTHGIMKNLTQVYEALRGDCGFATQKADTITAPAAIFKSWTLKGGRGGRETAPVEGSQRDLLCYRELIVDVGNARYLRSLVGDLLFLRTIFHAAAQCNSTVARNNGYVLSGCGQGTVRSESLSNVLCDLSVGFICRLIGCSRSIRRCLVSRGRA